MRRRRSQDVVRVCVPTAQVPFFHLPGRDGGWYISLLFGHGSSVDVLMQDLRKLITGSQGEVIVARRLTRAESEELECRRADCDAAVHGGIIPKEKRRFHRLRGKTRGA